MTREHNWADNHTFAATQIHRPETRDDVRRLVAAARRIRAIGARHSFNAIADSDALIDLGGLPPDFAIDRDRMTVSVAANTSYAVLADYLQAQGYALHNMASLPHISLAGAVATGTHGSGDANGTLATAVAGLEMVTAGGDLVRLRRGDTGFDGIVVGLGAFGVVTRMTLDIQPTFDVRQDAFADLPWDTLLDEFDAIAAAAYSISVVTRWSGPTADRLWLKTRLVDGAPGHVMAAQFGATPVDLPLVDGGLVDGGLVDDSLAAAAAWVTPFGGVPGPWSQRLAHFRPEHPPGPGEQIQSEYMLPRSQAVAALRALRAIGERIDAALLATELRTMAADDLWLSPAYGHAAIGIHFTWQRLPAAVAAITREVEDLLLPLGGRPHWGKVIHAPAATLAPLYSQLPAFCALARQYDPDGKFRNAFLARHVFGDG